MNVGAPGDGSNAGDKANPFKNTTNGGSFAPPGSSPPPLDGNSPLARSRRQVKKLKEKVAELKRLNAELQAKQEAKQLLDAATDPIEDELEDVLEQKVSEDGPPPDWLLEAEERLRNDLTKLEGEVSIARTELDRLLEAQNRVVSELLETQADLQVALAALRESEDGKLELDEQAQELQKELEECLSEKNNLEAELAVAKAQKEALEKRVLYLESLEPERLELRRTVNANKLVIKMLRRLLNSLKMKLQNDEVKKDELSRLQGVLEEVEAQNSMLRDQLARKDMELEAARDRYESDMSDERKANSTKAEQEQKRTTALLNQEKVNVTVLTNQLKELEQELSRIYEENKTLERPEAPTVQTPAVEVPALSAIDAFFAPGAPAPILRDTIKSGDLDKVNELLLEGSSALEYDEEGFSGIHWAVMTKNLDMVKIVSNSMDKKTLYVHPDGSSGRTALHWAIQIGFEPAVEYLLESAPDEMELLSIQEADGTTAERMARELYQEGGILSLVETEASASGSLKRLANEKIEAAMKYEPGSFGMNDTIGSMLKQAVLVNDTDTIVKLNNHLFDKRGEITQSSAFAIPNYKDDRGHPNSRIDVFAIGKGRSKAVELIFDTFISKGIPLPTFQYYPRPANAHTALVMFLYNVEAIYRPFNTIGGYTPSGFVGTTAEKVGVNTLNNVRVLTCAMGGATIFKEEFSGSMGKLGTQRTSIGVLSASSTEAAFYILAAGGKVDYNSSSVTEKDRISFSDKKDKYGNSIKEYMQKTGREVVKIDGRYWSRPQKDSSYDADAVLAPYKEMYARDKKLFAQAKLEYADKAP